MRFPDEFLAELRSRIEITQVIEKYIELKKVGSSYRACCPFHQEKTPSFFVNPGKQIFHCFGCHEGGNVFSFVQKMDRSTFPEAVRKMAEWAGVAIPETSQPKYQKPKTAPAAKFSSGALKALSWTKQYYEYLLTRPEGQKAHQYLRERNLSEETIKSFQLGYSPAGWRTLSHIMVKKGFTLAHLVEAGLVIQKNDKHYDRFRDRLMFPIHNHEGQVVGFGARRLDDTEEPKYLNSPETAFFPKRQLLYGYHQHQHIIRQKGEALIVEGYMDVIALFQAGVKNSLATMGTSLTDQHCRELKKLTRNIMTVFDSDKAGRMAWERSIEIFLKNGLLARDLRLGEELDPDDYITQKGVQAFLEQCQSAPLQTTQLLKEISEKGRLNEKEKAQLLEKLKPILAYYPNTEKKALLLDKLSLILNISISSLNQVIQQHKTKKSFGENSSAIPSQVPRPPQRQPLHPLDKDILHLIFLYPESLKNTSVELLSSLCHKEDLRHKVSKTHEYIQSHSLSEIISHLEHWSQTEADPTLMPVLSRLLIDQEQLKVDIYHQDWKNGFLTHIERLRQKQQLQSLNHQLKLSREMGDDTEQLRLLQEIQALRSQPV